MKFQYLAAALLLFSIVLIAPDTALSQPSETGSYAPGFWQPEATVDNTRNIKVKLMNETGMNIEYGEAGVNVYTLAPGGMTQLEFKMVPDRKGDITSLPINSPNDTELDFQYNVDEKENLVTVRISVAGANTISDRAVYIDEKGRVYSF